MAFAGDVSQVVLARFTVLGSWFWDTDMLRDTRELSLFFALLGCLTQTSRLSCVTLICVCTTFSVSANRRTSLQTLNLVLNRFYLGDSSNTRKATPGCLATVLSFLTARDTGAWIPLTVFLHLRQVF